MVDSSLPVTVAGHREAMDEFVRLNREIVKLYSTGLNTRQPVENAKSLQRGVHLVGRELRDVITPALSRFGVTLGFGAAAVAGTLVGAAKSAKDFAHATVEMGYIAKETGVSIETMKGYAAAAQAHGISNEAAMQSLQGFAKKADDIRLRMGALRAELVGWGDGGLVNALEKSGNNTEALRLVLARIDKLREASPDRARFLSEQLLGDYRFINQSLKEVERWAAMAVAPTKEQEEAARKFNLAVVELEQAFDDLKQELGVEVLPSFTRAMENLNKIFADDPTLFDQIVKGLEDAATAISQITKRDLQQSGRLFGESINVALKSASMIYRILEWVASQHASKEELETRPTPSKPWTWRLPSLGSVIGGMTGANAQLMEQQNRDSFDKLSDGLDRTKDLLQQINTLNEAARRGYLPSGGALGAGAAVPGGYSVGAGGPAANIPGFAPSQSTGGPRAIGPDTGAVGAGFVPGTGYGPGGGGPRSAGGDPSVVRQRRGGGGDVDAGALYKSYVAKFKGGPLDGYVPPDGPKWGINKGTPEEWAALALATSQQESGLNRNAPGGGLNQFGPGDLARYGLGGRNVNDPDAQAQALVNQWHQAIPKDKVIAGVGENGRWGGATRYFGSLRRRGEADRYLGWAHSVATEIDGKSPAPPTTASASSSAALLDWQGAMNAARANPQASQGGSATGFAKAPQPIIPDRTTSAGGLPGYMLDDAIRDENATLKRKLHINLKVKALKGDVEVRTNAQGESIASVTQQRQHTKEPQPQPQKAAQKETADAD
ncbi:hypothetical protein HAP48_0034985 [Bradyrhizobium septentrionale]|uniref:Phage tail lysozyme domain-containing protein n=1 Tax=Bradyrhizobium septentrionale TaxID=1404411 RepID=A0A973VZY1_9BRAD|nr:hypothetical protein [Bradyrhizobium septentrionale]UGY13739.1 hypothetical protein HAP48_0034985 [Bradyrhizobium septentrionale]